eukprot:7235417-Karenia_brevis.AAC.1
MGNAWVFLRLRYAKSWLGDMTPDVFRRYADFLMVPRVYSMPMPEGVAYRVPWSIVLGYELEIRREACKKVLEDKVTFASAIDTACKDTYLRDVYL